jgi:predicted anti-sigma-YlaC factor YlaD
VHDSGSAYDGEAIELNATGDEVTCQQLVELVTDYFERALERRTLGHVEEHLVMCDWCVTYADQMQTTIAALHELENQQLAEPPPAVLMALRTSSRR